jgi:hypothetical protein
VVGVLAAGPEAAVVGLAVPGLRAVVAVVAAAVGLVVPAGAAVVPVVAVDSTAALGAVLGGAPETANWPPRRKEGGPLWVSL